MGYYAWIHTRNNFTDKACMDARFPREATEHFFTTTLLCEPCPRQLRPCLAKMSFQKGNGSLLKEVYWFAEILPVFSTRFVASATFSGDYAHEQGTGRVYRACAEESKIRWEIVMSFKRGLFRIFFQRKRFKEFHDLLKIYIIL